MLRTASNTSLDEIPKPLKAVFMTCTSCRVCSFQKKKTSIVANQWKVETTTRKKKGNRISLDEVCVATARNVS